MQIKDRMTGKAAPGDWMDLDMAGSGSLEVECPECGASPGSCCSIPDPDQPGLGVEIHTFVHCSRGDAWKA